MRLELQGISARHVAARAGQPAALKRVNLTVQAGEQLAVVGPSGAGKTTLLQLLACAHRPASGGFALDGQDPWSLPRSALQRLRGRLFLAPQVPPLPPRQRVVTAVLAGSLPTMGLLASLRSLLYPRDIPAAHLALDSFNLADKLFERVDRLSGGERQRVGLARALVAPATLWLVDEPLSALDPTLARLATTNLVAQAQQRNVTLVASLHQVDMALAHFPRIVGLREGQVEFDLPTAEVTPALLEALYAQHEHELRGEPVVAAREGDTPATQRQPAVMHCR